MSPLPNSPFFRPPTKVSRLYPLLSLALLLVGSGIIYHWQLAQINANTAVQQRDGEISTLKGQVSLLTSQEAHDQTTLAAQDAQLKKITTDLATKQKALAEAESQLQQQQSQLAENSAELQQLRNRPPLFSFQNNSTIPDVATKETEIKSVVTNAYTYLQKIYGSPYLLNQVTITFVNQFTIAGAAAETSIENTATGLKVDIHLKDFDPNNFSDVNSVIHELGHTFKSAAAITSPALEEGETVAVTDVVMGEMIADKALAPFPYLYVTISPQQYTQWNKTLTIPADDTAFYQSSDVSAIYQEIGYAWLTLYHQDPNFFKNLNEMYYAQVQNGQIPNRALILQDIIKVLPQVYGQPTADYLSANIAFNPS